MVGLDDARSFLVDRYGADPADVEALGGGHWSSAYGFRSTDGRSLVARFGQWREDFEADRLAMSFAGPDLPVPEVLEIGSAFGGAFAVSVRHAGEFLESLDADGFHRVLPAVLRALDALRALPPPFRREEPWGSWLLELLEDRPGGRVSGWRSVLAATPEAEALFVAGRQAVVDLLPSCPDVQHVLHLDLLNRNVLVSGDRLSAVFDWGCLSMGDPLYEVAWFTFWAPWHPGLAAVDFRSAVVSHVGGSEPAFDERLRCYELHIGVHHLAFNAFAGQPEAQARLVERLRPLVP